MRQTEVKIKNSLSSNLAEYQPKVFSIYRRLRTVAIGVYMFSLVERFTKANDKYANMVMY